MVDVTCNPDYGSVLLAATSGPRDADSQDQNGGDRKKEIDFPSVLFHFPSISTLCKLTSLQYVDCKKRLGWCSACMYVCEMCPYISVLCYFVSPGLLVHNNLAKSQDTERSLM